jgi:hypothetical protein
MLADRDCLVVFAAVVQFETACGAFGRPDGDWGFEERQATNPPWPFAQVAGGEGKGRLRV